MQDIFSRSFRAKPASVKLFSLIIPVYNESRNLDDLVARLDAIAWPVDTEWIFINDGSKDDSSKIIKSIQLRYPRIRLIDNEKNRGKGAALRMGIDAAQGQIVAVQDADAEYDPADLLVLIRPLLAGKADVVYGSRFRADGFQVHRTFHRYVNRLLTLFSNLCSGIHVTDMETCYKVFRADIVKAFALQSNRFGFEPEITAYIAKFSLRVLEFPISYFPRNYAQGKKIGWKDGIAALWFIFKYNFLVDRVRSLKPHLLEGYRALPHSHTRATASNSDKAA